MRRGSSLLACMDAMSNGNTTTRDIGSLGLLLGQAPRILDWQQQPGVLNNNTLNNEHVDNTQMNNDDVSRMSGSMFIVWFDGS